MNNLTPCGYCATTSGVHSIECQEFRESGAYITVYVTVYHNSMLVHTTNGTSGEREDHENPEGKPCGTFIGFCERCILRPVYTHEAGVRYSSTDEDLLDYVYAKSQNGLEGSWNPEKTRSLSVGDVVKIERGDVPTYYSVAAVGFDYASGKDVETAHLRYDALKRNAKDGTEIW